MLNKLLAYAPFQAISALSVFIVLALQARLLEVEQYGVLALAMASAEIVRLFTGQWIISTFIRFYPQAEINEKKEICDFSLSYSIILLLPSLLIFFLAKLFYEPFNEVSTTIIFLFFASKTLFLYFHQVIRLREKTKKYQIAASIQAITACLFTWVAMTYEPSINNALAAMAFSYISAITLVSPKFKINLQALSIKRSTIYFSYGIPLALTGLVFGLSTRIDRFIISDLMDNHAVGMYSALLALTAGVMSLSFTLIALPLYPEVIKHSKSPTKLKDAHAQYLAILIALTLPILLGICFISTAATHLLLGEKYVFENQLPFYFIAIATYFINLKGHYFDHGLQFTLKTKLSPYIALFGLLINIPISYVLIHLFGLMGASVAAATTSLATLLLTWYLAATNNYNFILLADTKIVIFCSVTTAIIMAITKSFLSFSSYLQEISFIIPIYAALYAGLIVFTNPFKVRSTLGKLILTLRPPKR
ncbi:oligosaccharide flippase family protein [Pseudomonas fragi]|uniref:lipopolysaccharide biosynthesis protein n=1 Tax=Pseudomonas fragi TaxID=296 RepID=UPI0030A36FA7